MLPLPRTTADGGGSVSGRRATLDTGDAAMLATAFIWAGNNVIVKAYVDRIDPAAYVFGRFALVCILFFALLRLRGVPLRIARRDLPRFVLTGVTGYALYNLLFTVGLAHTSAFAVSVLVAIGPIFALVIAASLRIERVRPVQWAGVVVALLGVAVFFGAGFTGERPGLGDLLSILGAASFAVYSIATRPIVRTYGSSLVTAWSALIGLLVSLPVTLPAAIDQDWRGLDAGSWGALFYSAAISMLVAYTIWGWAIQKKGVGRTVPYLYLPPVITGVMAALFLGERFGPEKLLGGVCVLAGVGLSRRVGPAPSPAVSAVSPAAPEPRVAG